MNTVRTSEHAIEKLHNEWVGNLLAYEEELNLINVVTRQLQSTVNDLQFVEELHQLRTEIVFQTSAVEALSLEVSELRKRFAEHDDRKVLNIADLIENNRFRDKLRKTEQQVFMLKYQVNKFLSIAS